MKKILKKAELINQIADSVVIILLVEKLTKKDMHFYTTETYLYKLNGEFLSESKKCYTTYRAAASHYSSLIHMLN